MGGDVGRDFFIFQLFLSENFLKLFT